MPPRVPQTSWRLSAGCVAIGFLLAGCDGAPPPTDRQPQSRPAVQREPTAATTTPAATQPTTQPATTQPEAGEPELPEYLSIVERFSPHQRAKVTARIERGNRLVIETRNVRRLRIERGELPLESEKSIVLQLDGQGFEWLARSVVTDFERSENGEWRPTKPGKSRKPGRP